MADLTGGCLCGAIRYRISGDLQPVIACHCTQCRKTSGHHVAATSVLREDIEMMGAPIWFDSSARARRGFCGICGSNLFWDSDGDPRLSIFAGTIDGETGLQIAGHIFTDDKGDYYRISDGTPQRGGWDPELTTQGAGL